MSTGGLIGGIGGAVVGFMIGGFVGAAIGAGIGMGVGMMLDPVQPDQPTPGGPGEVSVNTCKEGTPVADALGTPKLNTNITWSCCSRSVETKEEQGGKGGGSQEVTTGYEYFLTWAVGICRGPVDKLFTVYANDKVVWSGELERPESGGLSTIYLDGMGYCDFYFGTADQDANSYMAARVADSTLCPAYRGQCYAVLKDCSLGDYHRAPSMFFVVQKTPSITGLDDAVKALETYDYNPAHALYYLMNRQARMGTDYLNATSFSDVALRLGGEARGVSIAFSTQREAMDWAEAILNHICGGVRWSTDAKLHLFLFRPATNTDDLPQINASDLTDVPNFTRKAWADVLNDYRVQYSKRIFREAACPNSCENFEGDTATEIAAGEERWFTIQDKDWTSQECGDEVLAFLSDGLPAANRGTFTELTYLGSGKWKFKYTASENLCAGQDFANANCPVICGHRIGCCTCELVDPVEFDTGQTPETISAGQGVQLYVKDGYGPYTWTIEWGAGYLLEHNQTSDKQNQVSCAEGSCGSQFAAVCKIKCTDACGNEAQWVLRNTAGQWVEKESAASCHEGEWQRSGGGDTRSHTITMGDEKWVLSTMFQYPACADTYIESWGGNLQGPCGKDHPPPCGGASDCAGLYWSGLDCGGETYPYRHWHNYHYYKWEC